MGCKCSKEEDEIGEYQTSHREEYIPDNIKVKSGIHDKARSASPENIDEQYAHTNANESTSQTKFGNSSYDQGFNEAPSMLSYDNSVLKKKKKKKEKSNYEAEIIKLFNLARTKPLVYCKNIDYAITLITTNYEGQLVLGTEHTNKIGLREGIGKFNECKRYILQLDPMCELELDNDLCLEIPEDPNQWLDHEYIKKQIINKQSELLNTKGEKKNYTVFGFHFDYGMADPSLSSVLQLVDDNNCENRRRYNILNPDYRAIGISHKSVGKKFCSYLFFAG